MANLAKLEYDACMKTVKIGALRNDLSGYLRYVRQGEEVIVCDRDKPVARILPIRSSSFDEHTAKLIARGILRPPIDPTPMDWDAFDALPAPTVSAEASAEAIRWAKGRY